MGSTRRAEARMQRAQDFPPCIPPGQKDFAVDPRRETEFIIPGTDRPCRRLFDGIRVAALVYMRRQHVVNVFVWPSSGSEDAEQRLIQVNGYNLVSWHRGGLAYWAVSDLNAGELRQLPNLL